MKHILVIGFFILEGPSGLEDEALVFRWKMVYLFGIEFECQE